MTVKRSNIIGIVIAAAVLVFALIAKSAGSENVFSVMLPIMALLMLVLCITDIYSYRKSDPDAVGRMGALIRIISLAVMSVLLTAAFVFDIIF